MQHIYCTNNSTNSRCTIINSNISNNTDNSQEIIIKIISKETTGPIKMVMSTNRATGRNLSRDLAQQSIIRVAVMWMEVIIKRGTQEIILRARRGPISHNRIRTFMSKKGMIEKIGRAKIRIIKMISIRMWKARLNKWVRSKIRIIRSSKSLRLAKRLIFYQMSIQLRGKIVRVRYSNRELESTRKNFSKSRIRIQRIDRKAEIKTSLTFNPKISFKVNLSYQVTNFLNYTELKLTQL